MTGRVLGAGAKPVQVFRIDGEERKSADGTFSVPVSWGEQWEMQIMAPGYAVWSKQFSKLKPDESVALGDVQLVTGRRVEGIVMDARTGVPVADALVDTGEAPPNPRMALYLSEKSGAVVTDGAGRFVIPNVAERSKLIVVVKKGYPQSRQPLDPSKTFIELLLDPGATVTGTVKRADGTAAEASVNARRIDGPPDRISDMALGGKYALKALARGRHVLTVTTRGDKSAGTGGRARWRSPVIRAVRPSLSPSTPLIDSAIARRSTAAFRRAVLAIALIP